MYINNQILIIDDDQELLKTYQMILSGPTSTNKMKTGLMAFADMGQNTSNDAEMVGGSFDIHVASNGEEGVELVRRFLEEERSFAVAFIDIRMPPGIDGLETSKLIREMDDRVYIIIATAYSDRSVDEIQMALQHDIVLVKKPLSGDEIIQLARNACNSWERDQKNQTRQATFRNKLRDEQWLLIDLINIVPFAIFICNHQGTIINCNQTAYQLIQYPKQLVTLNKITDFFIEEGIVEIMESLSRRENVRNIPCTISTYDETMIPVQVTAGVLRRCYECADFMIFIISQIPVPG